MHKRVEAPSSRAQSAPAGKGLVDRGVGRTPLKPVVHLPPPSALHLAAAQQFDRVACTMHSMRDLLGFGEPAPSEEQDDEAAAAAEPRPAVIACVSSQK